MKDFTKAAAQAWVQQELASCKRRGDDPKIMADQYEKDGKMFADAGINFPNATAARAELVAKLRAL